MIQLLLAMHISRGLVFSYAHKPGMPQVIVWRPFNVFKLGYQEGLQPPALFHFCRR
jgi:hypothetical protein